MQPEGECPKCGFIYTKFVKKQRNNSKNKEVKESTFPAPAKIALTLLGGGIGGAIWALLANAFFDLSGGTLFVIYIVFAVGTTSVINEAWDAIQKVGSGEGDNNNNELASIEK